MINDIRETERKVVIVLDLGGTIVEEANPNNMFAIPSEVLDAKGLDELKAFRILMGIITILMKENTRPSKEQLPATQMIQNYITENNINLTVEDIEELAWHMLGGENCEYLKPLPDAECFLKEIKDVGVDIVALSNTAIPLTLLNSIFRVHNIYDYFNEIILSSECGWRKPSDEIFDVLENKMSIQENDFVLLIGNDYKADIEPAIKRGYRTAFLQHIDASVEQDGKKADVIGQSLQIIKNEVLKQIMQWRENNEKTALA